MRTIIKVLAGILLTVWISCQHNQTYLDISQSVETHIDSLRLLYRIPAIACGVVRNDSVILQQVIGYRNIETKEEADLDDLFHIGSNTKSFTAFLAGKLVEQGLISWDTRFFDLFPEMVAESNPSYYEMTLDNLLSHRARLIPFKGDSEVYPIVDYERSLPGNLTLPEKRYHFIRQVVKYEPIPWYDHHDDRYSNAGYIAAALMLEKAGGKIWEQMIMEISEDLGLGIHIGWPDSDDPHQPVGHIRPSDWLIDMEDNLIPIPPVLRNYHYFNQCILLCTPSGHLSIPLAGFLKFIQLHLEGLSGDNNYLRSETYRHILTTYPDYSLGWAGRLFDRTCHHHRGSAGTFSSMALILPDRQLGVVIMTNTHSNEGMDEIAKYLIYF